MRPEPTILAGDNWAPTDGLGGPLRTAIVVFFALTVIHLWPLSAEPWRRSMNDHADAQLNAWIVAWIAHAAVTPDTIFDGNIFAPERHTLAYSEPLIAPALAVAPVAWAGASPAFLFNLLDAAGLMLTALSGWFVARRWTGSSTAGLVAGSLVAFNVHLLTRLAHLAATHTWGLPLTLYFADALVEQPRVRTALLLALVLAATAATSMYSLALCGVILAAVAIAGVPRWRGLLAIAAATAGGLVIAAPVLLPYLRMARAGNSRPIDMVADFSATLAGYLTSTSWVHGWWSRVKTNDVDVFFAGIAAFALAVIGIVRMRQIDEQQSWRRRRALLLLAIFGVVLSLGPATPIYRWLYDLFPPLRGIRAAARFGLLALVAVAFAAAYGVAWLERTKRIGSALLATILLSVVTIEAWQGPLRTITGAQRAPAIYGWLTDAPAGSVLVEVPFFPAHAAFENGEYVFNATAHWRPIMNGYSGFTPMSYRRRAEIFWRFPEPGVIEAMKSEGATHLMVHLERFGPREAPAVRQIIDTRADLRLIAADRDGHRLYELKPP